MARRGPKPRLSVVTGPVAGAGVTGPIPSPYRVGDVRQQIWDEILSNPDVAAVIRPSDGWFLEMFCDALALFRWSSNEVHSPSGNDNGTNAFDALKSIRPQLMSMLKELGLIPSARARDRAPAPSDGNLLD